MNKYVRAIREKYWKKFFGEPRFMGRLTSNLQNNYLSHINKFVDYDFSCWNIKTVQEEIAHSLIKGVEDCIVKLFDELSHKHSWSEDLQLDNIHYYNGWKTNSSWKINRRVVIPIQGFHASWYDGKKEFDTFRNGAHAKLLDIEKVLNYLDTGDTSGEGAISMRERLEYAHDVGRTKNIYLKYFTVTFYKKGTCRLTFTNERLLKKFNIFGSQRKGWLPKGYAAKSMKSSIVKNKLLLRVLRVKMLMKKLRMKHIII